MKIVNRELEPSSGSKGERVPQLLAEIINPHTALKSMTVLPAGPGTQTHKADAGVQVQMEAAKGMVRFLKREKDSSKSAEAALKFGKALKALRDSKKVVPDSDRKLLNNYEKSLYKKFPSVQKKLK